MFAVSADKSLELLPHFSDDEYMQENRVLLRNPESLNYKIKPIIKTEVCWIKFENREVPEL